MTKLILIIKLKIKKLWPGLFFSITRQSSKKLIFYLAKTQSSRKINALLEEEKKKKSNLIAKTLTTISINRYKKKKSVLIERKRKYSFEEPKVFGEPRKFNKRSVYIPEKRLSSISNAQIIGAFQIICDEKLLITEAAANPNLGFVAGIWPYVQSISKEKNKAIVWFEYNQIITLDEGILFSGRCSPNYFHWLIEYLGRAYIISKINGIKNIPLIIDGEMFDSEFESLQSVLPNWPIIKLPKQTLLKVKKLHIPSISTFHPDQLDTPYWKGSGICLETLKFLKSACLSSNQLDQFKSKKKKKIYITRKAGSHSGRNIINNREVEILMDGLGFEIIDPSELTFKAQIQIFMESSTIIGPMGAAFTNIIFCEPKTKIIALSSPYTKRFCMQSNLANFAQCDYIILPGYHQNYYHNAESSERDLDVVMASYYIDTEKLKKLIKSF
jgi:capsular polysaccharide biosynthesis protein